MPDALTAVVIGLGNVGKFHAQAYEEMGLKVIPADRHNWKLRVLEGDVVSVCSYDEAHAEQVIYSLEKQKHVMCEKPLCTTREELAYIKSLWEIMSSGLCLGQNFPLRHHHEFIRAKMENHGDIYRIEASYNYGRPPKDWWPSNYSIVLGGMIHMIDIVQWITGEKLKPISAEGGEHIRTALCEGPVVLTADFGRGVGRHEHYLRIHGTKNHTIIENHKSTDKKACVKEFVRDVQLGKCRDDFGAIETALEIERL